MTPAIKKPITPNGNSGQIITSSNVTSETKKVINNAANRTISLTKKPIVRLNTLSPQA